MSKLHRLFWIVAIFIFSSTGSADVPQLIGYQGILTDSLGNPVVDGDYSLTFSIYDAAEDGTQVWTSGAQIIPVVGGSFEYHLGSAVSLPDIFASDTLLYLGISIDGGPEASPRTRFLTTAYAFHSKTCVTAATAMSVAPDAISSVEIQDGSISFDDIGQNGAAAGQVMKWNGSAWVPAEDEGSLSASGWDDDGSVVHLTSPGDSVGIGTQTPQAKLDVAGKIMADVGYENENAIEGYVNSDMTAVYGENAIGTEGGLGGVDAGVWGSSSGGLWAGQFVGKLYTSGPLSIGSYFPASMLHMHGADPVLTIGTTTNFAGLRFRKNSTDKWEFAWDDVNDYLYLKSLSGGGTVMVIEDATGEVGFGTTSPAARVHARHTLGSYGMLGAMNTGVLGYSPGAGYGVKGDTEDGYAVYGSTSSGGFGVYGVNVNGPYGYLGGNTYGVYGHNPPGVAGYFDGDVRITDKLGIGDVSSLTNMLHLEGPAPFPIINTTGEYAYWSYRQNGTLRWEIGYDGLQDMYFFRYGDLGNPVLSLHDDSLVGVGVEDPISRLDVAGDLHLNSSTRGINWPPSQAMPFGTWNGSVFTERMRFAADGKVGINTDDPLDQLHIYGNVRIDGDGGAFLRFTNGGDMRWSWLYKSWANTTFQLWNETLGRAAMAFDETTGNVGINTTSPNTELDVNGDVNVSGNLTVSGSSPFPAPEYDSGWLTIAQGEAITLTHNLGVDANKYIVDFQQWSTGMQTHNFGYGIDNFNIGGDFRAEGAFFKNLNTATVTVVRRSHDDDTEKVRIRIWRYQ